MPTGVMKTVDAIALASEHGLDLIEITATANPPLAKIMDYGKFQYDEKKKQRLAKSRTQTTEIKNIQVKIGTGDHDLELKAKKASEWLSEGHRVKIDLYLSGRSKFMDINFHKERMDRIFKLITTEYKVVSPPTKGLKGLSAIIEKK